MADPRTDPVLMQFRSALDQLFGARIDRVLLAAVEQLVP